MLRQVNFKSTYKISIFRHQVLIAEELARVSFAKNFGWNCMLSMRLDVFVWRFLKALNLFYFK